MNLNLVRYFLVPLVILTSLQVATYAKESPRPKASSAPAKKTSSSLPPWIAKLPHDDYHKLMNGAQTIGKTSSHWSVDDDLLRFDEESTMKVTLFNKPQTISTQGKVWTNQNLEIQRLIFKMQTTESSISIDGERVGSRIRLKITQANNTQQKEIQLQEPVLMSSTLRPYLLMKGLPATKSELKAVILEPSALTTVPITMQVSKKAENLWLVSLDYLQHQMTSEISGNGSLLSEKSDFAGLEIITKPAAAEEFKKLLLEGTKSDLVEMARVAFPPLSRAKELKKLSVKISGVDTRTFDLSRHRQSLKGDVLTVEVESLPKESVPVQSLIGQPSLETYLQGDAMTEVYDPVIQKKAREIVGSESDLWKRAVLIHQFVHKELEKTPTVSIPNALEVLKTKKGDCNEHAVLFTALARAAGIPARTVVGLVYSMGAKATPGFYYHAWVEVYTGKGWLAMDPTWNQIPADATHIAFVEGGLDQQVQVTSLMGKIKLTLVSSEPPSL